MEMKIRFSYIPLATTLALVFAGLGCQSAHKPVASSLVRTQAPPPPIQAQSAPPTAPDVSASHPRVEPQKSASTSAPVTQQEAKPDPVQELIAKTEAEYKAG